MRARPRSNRSSGREDRETESTHKVQRDRVNGSYNAVSQYRFSTFDFDSTYAPLLFRRAVGEARKAVIGLIITSLRYSAGEIHQFSGALSSPRRLQFREASCVVRRWLACHTRASHKSRIRAVRDSSCSRAYKSPPLIRSLGRSAR